MKRLYASLFCIVSLQASNEEALSYKQQKKYEDAKIAFENALAQDPHNAHLLFEYGSMLADLDQKELYPKAIDLLERSIRNELNINRLFYYGTFCCKVGEFQKSLAAYQRILEKHPNQIPVLYNAGYTFKCAGDLDTAIALYTEVLRRNPDYEPAHLGLAFSYISKGDFKKGWQEHEWNLKKQGKFAPELRRLLQTNQIAGKRILLKPEGGLGDSLNFIRYAQRLKHMGAYIIVALQPAFIPLFSHCPYIDELMPTNSVAPAHDAWATLMSLPAAFYDDETSISHNIPYIFPPQERIEYWTHLLKKDHNLKIGICWQPDVHNDVSRIPIARRGIPLSHFFELASTPGISVYSLQKVGGLDQLQHLPPGVTIHQFDDSFDSTYGSFVDTAAVMQQLDLIISADTATAHLAGALGRPVWLLLPYVTDWRWLHNRTDSPWYPTMHIYKQPDPWNWDTVEQHMMTDIKKRIK